MDRLLNDIISIFIDQQIRQLRTVDISEALNRKGISCTTSEILLKLTPYAPTLFKLESNSSFTTIQVEPQVKQYFFLQPLFRFSAYRLIFVRIFNLGVVMCN